LRISLPSIRLTSEFWAGGGGMLGGLVAYAMLMTALVVRMLTLSESWQKIINLSAPAPVKSRG
jgi:hypothetical protein